MKRRYSIYGTEYGSDHEVELAQVDGDPQPVLDGYVAKTISLKTGKGGKRRSKIRKYTWLRIVENAQG
jgi:hypothetical protein